MALKTTRGDKGGPLKGRGASSNVEGRYESTTREAFDDGWSREAEEPPPRLETVITPETAKTIIARNDSPDIPFDQSINSYRGCEHGCVYCMEGDTPILMGDGGVKPLGDLQVGDEIYGTEQRGHYRYFVKTPVLAHWRTRKAAYRVRLANGTELVASADHRFLTERGWKFVAPAEPPAQRPRLALDDALMGPGAMASSGDLEVASARAVISNADLRIVAIERMTAERDLFDITTGTGNFIANGVISHNCYARPSHAYLGLSPGLDFETRIFAKTNAAALLRKELSAPGYRCSVISLGANTDPYQPAERELRITRSILEVFAEFQHPFTIVTKNALVERDLDLIAPMAARNLARVFLSVTNLDPELARRLEPRASAPHRRLEAIRRVASAGVPCGALVAPIIPFLNDGDLEAILEAAKEAGATWAGYIVLRLPHELKGLFKDWLTEHYPLRAERIMARIRDLRGGRENDPRFGARMEGTGDYAELIRRRFEHACRRVGLERGGRTELDTAAFRVPGRPDQLSLL